MAEASIGIVIIGRNEGERLVVCLRSVLAAVKQPGVKLAEIIYVDSNSTDESVANAREAGAHVVMLDTSIPFTAARARNAGAEALMSRHPEVEFIQFSDGDTEMHPHWLCHAAEYLRHHPKVAVACGRRRERFPDASVFNLLCDMELDVPPGPAQEFGGDAFVRAASFLHHGGYNTTFIAGEEPDLAARMRKDGLGIMQLNHPMSAHDLAMFKLSQWWKRTVRSGHALAQLYHTHGGAPLHFYKRAWHSTLFWAVAVPAGILAIVLWMSWWALALLPVAYGYLIARILRHRLRRGDSKLHAAIYALFTTIGKFPQMWGALKFHRNRLLGRQTRLMEYKSAKPVQSPHPLATSVGNT